MKGAGRRGRALPAPPSFWFCGRDLADSPGDRLELHGIWDASCTLLELDGMDTVETAGGTHISIDI